MFSICRFAFQAIGILVLGVIAIWHDPFGVLPFIAVPFGLFTLVTWLAAPKKAPRLRIDDIDSDHQPNPYAHHR